MVGSSTESTLQALILLTMRVYAADRATCTPTEQEDGDTSKGRNRSTEVPFVPCSNPATK